MLRRWEEEMVDPETIFERGNRAMADSNVVNRKKESRSFENI